MSRAAFPRTLTFLILSSMVAPSSSIGPHPARSSKPSHLNSTSSFLARAQPIAPSRNLFAPACSLSFSIGTSLLNFVFASTSWVSHAAVSSQEEHTSLTLALKASVHSIAAVSSAVPSVHIIAPCFMIAGMAALAVPAQSWSASFRCLWTNPALATAHGMSSSISDISTSLSSASFSFIFARQLSLVSSLAQFFRTLSTSPPASCSRPASVNAAKKVSSTFLPLKHAA
mmetsp:Transcript_30274/g.70393  ORF Transcript_30274/g.70393 Transcript_30274/m.70393 type:complete len:228 (-) Transcript_30274:203-886(-)